MNYGHLERIPVTLTVKSPLYIGSGEKLTAMEYILDDRNTVYVPSIPAMIDAFSNAWQRGLSDDFLRFIMAPGKSKKLGDFIRQRRLPLNPLPKWVCYTVQAQRDIRGMNTFLTFIKNPDGQAYIPGSSIKGALRTALIALKMDDRTRKGLWEDLHDPKKDRRMPDLERTLRMLTCSVDDSGRPMNNAVNDLLRAIEISDSAALPVDALTVCCRHWLSENGEERQSRSPIYMECLRPGIQTRFYLTVDHSLWPEGVDAVAILRQALSEWDALCHRAHQDYFQHFLGDLGLFDGAPIVLGGGAGFHRKSLIYKTSDYPEQAAQLAHEVLRRQFTQRNGRCTYRPPQGAKTAPYLFKAARFEGAYYPLGVCVLQL